MMDLNPPIGCFGGTFNPPHRAHFALAHAACERLHLAELLMIPAGQPWQKPHVLPAVHRLAMLRAAMADEVQTKRCGRDEPYPLSIETLEIDLPQASYTIDTLSTLRARFPDSPLVWVMGSDQLRNLTTWREWIHLLDLAHIAVVQRAGAEVTAADLPAPLNGVYAQRVCLDGRWRESLQGRFIPFEFDPIAVSSSDIRAAISGGQTADSISALSPSVAHYITQHQLYVTSP
ncbi:putative nicotinate-nucleotide adenylyltransferase [Ephemeroptericola cinctiostellae]|uniref:Probable nicotinate-nucleotide adenylyltransferase n=1 Tax=Ephemeroptericola cinctiostellae TaxID=2268024 RepID=A0A345DEA7_9BURK|nr:nicotinate (nicotinamide) nucleotide adenylyltransferase [Ephemeroptericola cinctiostellae]AXF86695.1 putative nicotinate-nucleotide adenylyltransferase [Ephemeroptericola cinctiostellae]